MENKLNYEENIQDGEIPEREMVEETILSAVSECISKEFSSSLVEMLSLKIQETLITNMEKESKKFFNTSSHSLKQKTTEEIENRLENLQANIEYNPEQICDEIPKSLSTCLQKAEATKDSLLDDIAKQQKYLEEVESNIDDKIYEFNNRNRVSQINQ
ncbi:unnamed protein product [Moneuplotes crassus]|uniref:Uncharacterized protein n=1 Tax=Euplotes crassus TaxID=5936 RepID=A0AAD2D969_EUPCR|nr:unnamed protein product [Moneuplotes crassus]